MKRVRIIVEDKDGHTVGCFDEAGRRVKQTGRDIRDWVARNRDDIILAGSIVIPILGSCAKSARRHHRMEQERQLKTRYIYDNHTRRYYHLKRDLTVRERLEIERREQNGERLGQILASMRVLK